MNTPAPNKPQGIAKKDAEIIGRLINMAYGNAILYGGKHQTVRQSAEPLLEQITLCLKIVPLLTISIEHDSLYVESFCVDAVINSRRLITYLKKAGIASITFDTQVTVEAIRSFLRISGDLAFYKNVDTMKQYCVAEKVTGIRLNYVIYQKVTIDEAIVKRETATMPAVTSAGSITAEQAAAFSPIANVISLHQLLADPTALAQAITATDTPQTHVSIQALSGQIRSLRSNLNNSDTPFTSIEEMLESVSRLRSDVAVRFDELKATGTLLSSQNAMTTELEKLSQDCLVRLICDEYKNGSISVKRMGNLIRRMIPDIDELKIVLPRIKEGLLGAGMPITDYLVLVKDLLAELKSESLTSLLSIASDDIGLSIDDLLECMKSDPSGIARLIVLGAEIRNVNDGENDELATILTEYIERLSSTVAVNNAKTSSKSALGSVIGTIQSQLVDSLKGSTVSQSLISSVEGTLKKNTSKLIDQSRNDLAVKVVTAEERADETVLVSLISDMIPDLKTADSPPVALIAALQTKGFTESQIKILFERAHKLSVAKKDAAKNEQPKGILSLSATLFFLEREVKRTMRYHTPFSVLMCSITGISVAANPLQKATDSQSKIVTGAILSSFKKTLRDLDLIGTMAWGPDQIPIALLPMTDSAGSAIVLSRLISLCQEDSVAKILPDGTPKITLSYVTYDPTQWADHKSYLKHIMENHLGIEQRVRARHL